MGKLNQVIAVEKGIKSRVIGEIDKLDKAIQKGEQLFNGFKKEYKANDEDGEKLPAEGKRVQFTVPDVLRHVARLEAELLDITARKDWTNTAAMSDVTVDGKVVLKDVPIPYLLFLEKQLTDLRTLFGRLPILDDAESWEFDTNVSLYKTQPAQTHRTKKTAKPVVLYNATPEHPAQTQMVTEDIISGYWRHEKHSGAIPSHKRHAILERTEKLRQAVIEAREAANTRDEVASPKVGEIVFSFLLDEGRSTEA